MRNPESSCPEGAVERAIEELIALNGLNGAYTHGCAARILEVYVGCFSGAGVLKGGESSAIMGVKGYKDV